MQQALLPADAPTVAFPRPSGPTPNQALGSCDLQRLGERLRVTYGQVESALPARLAELVERLARREQPNDEVERNCSKTSRVEPTGGSA